MRKLFVIQVTMCELRRIMAYLLTGAYLFSLCNWVIPIFADVIAHTFWKYHHMATVHYENGKWHVHKQIESIAKDGDKKQNPSNTQNNTESISFHIPSTSDIKFEQISGLHKTVVFHLCELQNGFLNLLTPPPKFF